jgi:hypothetical protein
VVYPPAGATTSHVYRLHTGWTPKQPRNEGALNTVAGERGVGDLGGLLVVPEDRTAMIKDDVTSVVNDWYVATQGATYSLDPAQYERYMLPPAQATTVLAGASGVFLVPWMPSGVELHTDQMAVLSAGADPRRALRDAHIRTVGRFFAVGDSTWSPRIDVYIDDNLGGAGIYARSWVAGRPSPVLQLVVVAQVGGAFNGTLPLQATTLLEHASHPLVLDLVKSGDRAYLSLRQTNANGIGIVAPAGATTVPVACVGITASYVTRLRGRPVVGMIGTRSPNIASAFVGLMHVSVEELGMQARASDSYVFDGVREETSRSGRVAVDGWTRGKIPAAGPSTALFGFAAPADGGAFTEGLGVEVRLRDRFRFAR